MFFSLLSGVLLIYFVVSLVYLCRDSLDSSLQVLLDGGVLCPIHLRSEVSCKRTQLERVESVGGVIWRIHIYTLIYGVVSPFGTAGWLTTRGGVDTLSPPTDLSLHLTPQAGL